LIVEYEDHKRPVAGFYALKLTGDLVPRRVLEVWLTFNQ
jgi:hypothetical protein